MKKGSFNRIKKISFVLFTVVIFILAIFFDFLTGSRVKRTEASGHTSLEANIASASDHILIKFKDTTSQADQEKIKKDKKIKKTKTVSQLGVERLEISDGKNSYDEVIDIRREYSDLIDFVELDAKLEPSFIPNDPELKNQWALPKINAFDGWDITKGSDSVTIAVLDTGVNNVADISNKIVPGWNTAMNNDDLTDLNGHGTAMMGIAGAQTNNNLGIAGLAIEPKIMMLRISDNSDGWAYSADMAEAIIYAANHDVKIMSISFGGFYPSATIRNAVNYAHSRGAFIAAAAGNSASSEPSYPAAYEHVVSVGATDSKDRIATFSNYGSTVDVVAPGVSIRFANRFGGYSYGSGTSPATPYVAALASLLKSQNADLTPNQIESYIKNNTDDLGTTGRDDIFAYGRINVKKTLEALSGPAPVLPTGNLTGAVKSSWENIPLVGAKVIASKNGTVISQAIASTDGSYTIANLEEDIYTINVTTPGHLSGSNNWVVIHSGVNTEENFTLNLNTTPGILAGKVLTYNGVPAYKALVIVTLIDTPRLDIDSYQRVAYTNNWGRFYLKNVPEGTYYVRTVWYSRFARKQVDVTAGNRTNALMYLSRWKYYELIRTWLQQLF